jgi:SNF2 family DNA or RNA helicase
LLKVDTSSLCKVVYSLYEHEYLGILIEPWIVQLTNAGNYSLIYNKIYSQRFDDYEAFLTANDKIIIKTLEECDQEFIIKKFYKKPERPSTFYPKYYTKEMHQVVRPYIEKRLVKALLMLNKSPFFEMGKDGNPTANPIKISNDISSVLFHFRRNEESTRYFPTIKYQNERIDFMYKNPKLISESPAILYVNNQIYFFEEHFEGKKLTPFFDKHFIDIPKKSEKVYFQKFVVPLIEKYHVYAEGFEIVTDKHWGKAIIKIVKNWQNENAFVLYFEYNKHQFPYNNLKNVHAWMEQEGNNYTFHRIKRAVDWEQSLVKYLLSQDLEQADGASFSFKNPEVRTGIYPFIEWLIAHKEELKKWNVEFDSSSTSKEYIIAETKVSLDIEEGIDWFDIKAYVYFGDVAVPLIKLKNHILNKIQEYELPDGRVGIIPESYFSRFSEILLFNKESNSIKIDKVQLGLIKTLKGDGIEEITFNRKLETLLSSTGIDETKISKHFKGELRSYQKAGYNWFHFLRQFNFGGCLADDMGLGKTIQTLAFLQSIKDEHEKQAQKILQLDKLNFQDVHFEANHYTSLIVMPISLIHNWLNEAEKFTPNLKIFVYKGTDRIKDIKQFEDYDIVLTTYGIVRVDHELLAQKRFNYIILDESQVIKNPNSKVSKMVKTLKSNHRLILTGTPVENSVDDLWSQMNFLNPGLLGSYKVFKEEFATPIQKNLDEEKLNKLQQLIKPFILRRTKEQVAPELPPKQELLYFSEMSDEQKKLYEETKSNIRNSILESIEQNGMNNTQFFILQGLLKLRQIANHPLLVDPNFEGDSGKFNDIVYSIETAMSKGHKILVFSQFVSHLQILKQHIAKNNIPFAYLDGQTKDREAAINHFRLNDDVKLFLISLKAGGVGLNLIEADYVYLLDPWWNPQAEQQAIDRTHRIGQTKNVFIYRFITKDTVEEKIVKLQDRKKVISESLITSEEGFVKTLNKEDIEAILA